MRFAKHPLRFAIIRSSRRATRGIRESAQTRVRIRVLKRVTELREANYYGAEESEELRKEIRLLCGNRYVEYHGWTSGWTEYAQ